MERQRTIWPCRKPSRSGACCPATTFAEQVQDAIDQGADLGQIRRHFHLSESELRDYCADIMDDGGDEDWSATVADVAPDDSVRA